MKAALEASPHRSAQLLADVLPDDLNRDAFNAGPRKLSSAMTRLRCGVSRLAADAHHLGLAASPACACGHDTECREHYLLHCPLWTTQRDALWARLADRNVIGLELPCSAETLLGAANVVKGRSDRRHIALAVQEFVRTTGRFENSNAAASAEAPPP